MNDKALLAAIDSFYISNPRFKAPDKWTIYDGFSETKRVGSFANERRFYFGPPKEELYEVVILPEEEESSMVITAIHDNDNWHLPDELNSREIERIEERFDNRIITKLEKITNSKCVED